MNKIIFLLTIFFTLTSCSVFSPVKMNPQTTYVINALPKPSIKKSSRHVTLLVTLPETNPLYGSREMAYTNSPYQIAYFAKNIWAEQPSEMIYPLLVQTLQNTRHFHAVVTISSAVNYEYVLTTQIQQLLQDYTDGTPRVYLTVRAQLIHAATNRVIATKEITIVEYFPQRTPFSGVVAANRATEKMLQHLTKFCVHLI